MGSICCSTAQFMSQHLRDKHSESVSEHQIPVLLEMCERPLDLHVQSSCSLCLEELSLLRLQGHLAEHREDIVIFVLPTKADDEPRSGSPLSDPEEQTQFTGAPYLKSTEPDGGKSSNILSNLYSKQPSRETKHISRVEADSQRQWHRQVSTPEQYRKHQVPLSASFRKVAKDLTKTVRQHASWTCRINLSPQERWLTTDC